MTASHKLWLCSKSAARKDVVLVKHLYSKAAAWYSVITAPVGFQQPVVHSQCSIPFMAWSLYSIALSTCPGSIEKLLYLWFCTSCYFLSFLLDCPQSYCHRQQVRSWGAGGGIFALNYSSHRRLKLPWDARVLLSEACVSTVRELSKCLSLFSLDMMYSQRLCPSLC